METHPHFRADASPSAKADMSSSSVRNFSYARMSTMAKRPRPFLVKKTGVSAVTSRKTVL
jgi:hypothetical protein